MLLSCLKCLALGPSTAQVLNWTLNLCKAATMLDWIVINLTWFRYDAAKEGQGMPQYGPQPRSRLQPYGAYWAFP